MDNIYHETERQDDTDLVRRRSRGSTIVSDSGSSWTDDVVPGAYPTSQDEDPDTSYTEYLQQQKQLEDEKRLEKQTSKQLQEHLQLLRQQAVEAKCRETQEIKRIDEILRELAASPGPDSNGMVGPAPAKLAFYGRSTFVKPRFGSGMDIYGSAPPARDSPLSYAFRGSGGVSGVGMSGKKLSLYESAPGSRWPKRLSAERNCGFKTGAGGGLRKDAMIEEEERQRRKGRPGREGRIPVPTALAEAMRRGQVIAVDGVGGRMDGKIEEMDQQTLVELVPDDEDAWETEGEEDERAGKTNGISNIKIQKRVTEKVDDIIVRQVGVKKWSWEEHMRKNQRRRRSSENVA